MVIEVFRQIRKGGTVAKSSARRTIMLAQRKRRFLCRTARRNSTNAALKTLNCRRLLIFRILFRIRPLCRDRALHFPNDIRVDSCFFSMNIRACLRKDRLSPFQFLKNLSRNIRFEISVWPNAAAFMSFCASLSKEAWPVANKVFELFNTIVNI